MDDLKTSAKNDEQQRSQVKIVKQFSDDNQMEFGRDKCENSSFNKGKLTFTD